MNTTFSCGKRQKNYNEFLQKASVFTIFLLTSAILIYNFQIIPILTPYACASASTAITTTVQNAIKGAVAKQNKSIVSLKYDQSGNVVSLETDTALLSEFTASITESVIEKLEESNGLTVKIPLGNLSGGALLTGKGPNISIPLSAKPKITCKIENEFYESGINQTLHRIIASVNVDTYVLIPSEPKNISVNTDYCISETVIVGKVPDAYTKINRLNDDITESEIDDIYDFSAG